jgi:hypothetical protein
MYENDSIAGDMFASDALLPAQYYDNHSKTLEPERRLLLALLVDAVRCYQTGITAPGGSRTRLFAEAERWLFKPQRNVPFAFEDICDVLEIDPAYLRRGLRRWRDRRLANEAPQLVRRSPVILRKRVAVHESRSRRAVGNRHRRQGSSSFAAR